MKKIDWYIIKKFLSTFFFTISLILLIVIIFDVSEKIDDFLRNDVAIKEIIFKYYLNFIPYFTNLFSPLFIFISVIYFTSKMANNSEIIAILNSGMSFSRLLRPFIISAVILSMMSFVLGNFIIPHTNKGKIDFENKYIRKKQQKRVKNIHMQIKKDQYIYLESYNKSKDIGYKFTLENFKDNTLKSKLSANYIQFDTINNKWKIKDYFIRIYNDKNEDIIKGKQIDTLLNLKPTDFSKNTSLVETMGMKELNQFIKKEEIKGTAQITFHKIEKHKRIANPFSSIILTIIAVAIGSRKIRGGSGIPLSIGLIISFSYILFMQVSTTFATNGNLLPVIAVWIPNIIFSLIAIIFIKLVPK
ncbi:MAG: YjgP/YjgQ family permease [Flavobacteriales bacterium]|jgi:lipopolysaccharide export system permease protein|nr:YjgP/YjgQ family permease [Flavobacteriales bacterium]